MGPWQTCRVVGWCRAKKSTVRTDDANEIKLNKIQRRVIELLIDTLNAAGKPPLQYPRFTDTL
jgi:hypothetical protein